VNYLVKGRLTVPILYIAANGPRLGDSPASRAYPADVETVGSGHFCQLEVPGQINAMIRRFLAVALPANVHDLG
jgi:pimeloyl-ACP methyl ester carboxylesterase